MNTTINFRLSTLAVPSITGDSEASSADRLKALDQDKENHLSIHDLKTVFIALVHFRVEIRIKLL